jgi:hypothetical protein
MLVVAHGSGRVLEALHRSHDMLTVQWAIQPLCRFLKWVDVCRQEVICQLVCV